MDNYKRFPPSQSVVDICEPFDDIATKAQFVTADFPPLYTRTWQTIKAPQCLERIRVMQFNMLAEGLSAHPTESPPFTSTPEGEAISPSDCGGFDMTADAATVFDFNGFRRWRLLQEILHCAPDVLAVEECDHFHDFFHPALSSVGYEGLFQPKNQSPSTKYGYYSDGVALFWKPQVMSLISLEGDDGPLQLCRDSPAVHIVVALRHNFTGEPVLFACTHLKAKGGDEFEAIRAGQVSAVLDGVEELAERLGMPVADGVKSGTRRCRSIIMGDFNAEACTSSSGSAAVAIPIALNWCDGYLSSAYTLPTSHADDLYTTWKTRGGTDFKRMIDYILYSASSGLEVAAVLEPPSPEEIATSACKLPDIRYPSDHISIAADINIIVS